MLVAPWTVQSADGLVGPLPATLPSCVHQTLMQAGEIRDPNAAGGEAGQLWVGRTGWVYRASVQLTKQMLETEWLELVFASIDTAATVFIGGIEVGSVCNQFYPHRFAVPQSVRARALLQAKLGIPIEVHCRAPVAEVESLSSRLGARPVNGDWTPYVFLRKAACNFGWDWAPRVATCGLGEVSIQWGKSSRIESVRPHVTECDRAHAIIEVHVDVGHAGEEAMTITARLESADGVLVASSSHLAPPGRRASHCLRLSVSNPQLWWPRGMGLQPLYRLTVQLEVEGRHGDSWRGRVGIRTVKLNQTPDARGAGFALEVNGERVFCRGANWVPSGLFAGYGDAAVVRHSLESAAEVGVNMLRVWGGGVYESRAFYDTCDELGVMVWQDFMFACATYSEQEHFPKEIEKEARYQVARLCRHPSIVLWCGGNENIWAWHSWGFGSRLTPGQSWGKKYWMEMLPAVVSELDPARPYWNDSPYSGTLELFPNDPDRGDCHAWEHPVGAEGGAPPRFVSEFGRQAYPNLQTLREAVGEKHLQSHSPEMQSRQKGTGGDARLIDPVLGAEFPDAGSFAERVWQTQWLQARAVRRYIVWLRANAPESSGALVWQWNDSWAGLGFGALDSTQRRKPMWYAMREACAPRALGLCMRNGGEAEHAHSGSLCLEAINDTGDEWIASATLSRITCDGSVRGAVTVPFRVPPRGCATIAHIGEVLPGADGSDEFVVAECASLRTTRMLASPRTAVALIAESCGGVDRANQPRTAEVRRGSSAIARVNLMSELPGVQRWMIEAVTPLLDLWLEPLGDWIEVEPNLISLLPGESQVLVVRLRGGAAGVRLWTPLGEVK